MKTILLKSQKVIKEIHSSNSVSFKDIEKQRKEFGIRP